MIYAVALPKSKELVIAGADSLEEQQQFLKQVSEVVVETDVVRYLSDPAIKDFLKMPTILQFETEEQIDEVVAQYGITLLALPKAVAKQKTMFERATFKSGDQRTIAELAGIPLEALDRRSDKQKSEDEKNKAKEMAKRQEQGDVTGSSFGDEDQMGALSVQDWGGPPVVHEDGTVEFGNIFASKGLFTYEVYHIVLPGADLQTYKNLMFAAGHIDKDDEPGESGMRWSTHPDEEGILVEVSEAGLHRFEQSLEGVEHRMERRVRTGSAEATHDPNWVIAEDFLVEVYFRVEVRDQTLAQMEALLESRHIKLAPISRDVEGFGCWMAYVRERDAQAAASGLKEENIEAEIVAVDPLGQRMLEEGVAKVTVVDSGQPEQEPPLPWNDRADEFAQMTDEEKKRALLGRYLMFTMRDYGGKTGRIVHIAPKSYFLEHERIWDGDLDLSHLLDPETFEKLDPPGVYRADMGAESAIYMLKKAGMIESLALRQYANLLPDFDQRKRDKRVAEAG